MISTGPWPRVNRRALAWASRPEMPVAVLGEQADLGTQQRSHAPARRRPARSRRRRPRAPPRPPTVPPGRSAPPAARRSGSGPSSGSSARRTVRGRGARAISRTARGADGSATRAQPCSKRYIVPAGAGGAASSVAMARPSDLGEHRGARAHQLDQRGHGGRLARSHLVGVVGDEADQCVRQLELSAQHGLRAARLTDRHDAAGGELRDLGGGVEPRPVDVAVGAAVAHLCPDLAAPATRARRESPPRTARRAGSSGPGPGSPSSRKNVHSEPSASRLEM